jgi:predicted metalloprotease with PDZ domain
VINQRGGVIAGTAVKNQFVCFVRPTVSEHALNILLAHEMFHDWLPNRLDVQIADGDYRFRHEWFTEGFPTYFAKRILLDAGLLSAEKFADMVNEEIRELADNPESRATYSTLAAAMRDKRFTSEHKELAYNRGALIALNWESQLQRTTSERDLSGLVRELFKFAAARNAKITEEELFDFARKYGLDGRGDFERHIIRGQPIELNADVSRLLGKRFNWVEIDFPSFDPGFDLTDTRQTRIVTGVRADGPAFRAGLRNGMELVNLRNSRRGVGWSETRQLIVIARANGQERTIQLIPHGKPIRLRQIKY